MLAAFQCILNYIYTIQVKILCCCLVASDKKLCFVCNVGLLYKVYIFQYVNVFKTIVFSVKNSKTMYTFLVLSK